MLCEGTWKSDFLDLINENILGVVLLMNRNTDNTSSAVSHFFFLIICYHTYSARNAIYCQKCSKSASLQVIIQVISGI